MDEYQRLRATLGVLFTVTVFGVAGFMLIEDLSLVDALYETVITISTVGYTEPAGGLTEGGRIFTAVLIIVGVGSVFYTAAVALEVFIDEVVVGRRRARREERMIDRMQGHTIVCGYGRVGSSVAARLAASAVDVVVVDANEDRVERARAHDVVAVRGDATQEEVLTAAGLDRAGVIIACVHGDSDNLSIVLSARVRRPDLYVLARASDQDVERRIKMAGANRVITPPEVGAERLAALVLNPDLTEFVDIAAGDTFLEFRVEQMMLSPGSELAGQTLADNRIRSRVGTLVLAVRQSDGTVVTNPPADTVLGVGDALFAMGTADQLEQLEKLV